VLRIDAERRRTPLTSVGGTVERTERHELSDWSVWTRGVRRADRRRSVALPCS
jgi:hypothetical protein